MYRPSSLQPRDIQLYRVCDGLSEGLIYFMIVFSPWAFGTTQPWSIWTMNIAGYLAGLLLAAKLYIRHKGYRVARWAASLEQPGATSARRLRWVLASLTGLILAFCFTSALNARATFSGWTRNFVYHDHCIRWLPYSLDSALSWPIFWNYLALACAFWAIVDWLPGKTPAEERRTTGSQPEAALVFPSRLRRLLWVLALNGAALAVEGIIQRLEGSGRLLFLVQPKVNPGAESQFGPYAYRANASSYFNLVWPICLGFWWTLHRVYGWKRQRHHFLLLSAALMAACPIISTSRAGAIITAGILALATCFLLATHFLSRQRWRQDQRHLLTSLLVLLFAASTLLLGYFLGWKQLKPRMHQLEEGRQYREAMYEAARPMANDYPLFGTGPGTFWSVFQLYRRSDATYWPIQLHNDWLETRITFGWVGSAFIAGAFLTALLRWFLPGGIRADRQFMVFVWLALAGCLVHARWDLPFQIYSLLFLVLLLCAVLVSVSRRP